MTEKNVKSVVLLSGGLDSAVCLLIAKEHAGEVYSITVDYGQKNRKEISSARKLAAAAGVKEHKEFKIDLTSIGGSALTDSIEVPRVLSPKDEIPVTYVPGRNLIFLALAVAWAEKLGAVYVYIGANVIDYSGYPDCRPEFLESFERTASLATKDTTDIKVNAPLISMSKADIVKEAGRLGLNIDMTSSCYEPEEDGSECGSCDSCRVKQKGIMEALGR